MKALWIFSILIIFCIYVLIGLYITEGIDSIIQLSLTWIIYTILCLSFLNVFVIGYFWSVLHNKKGPTGLRGPSGENGNIGLQGTCSINASELYLIKILSEYIDGLYNSKTQKSIINADNNNLPINNYLTNKLSITAGSRQYKIVVANLSKDGKPVINVINYLKSIWKQWFDLIYDATSTPGEWFEDEYADEDYNWVGDDPFKEIRKYDVYYWGITRNFRSLKAEICRSTLTFNSDKIPQSEVEEKQDIPAEPRLKVIQTNDYSQAGINDNNDDNVPASWWKPNVHTVGPDTYYPVGGVMTKFTFSPGKGGNTIVGKSQYAQQGNGPDMKTVIVSGDVVDPVGYTLSADPHTKDRNTQIYSMQCPSGYTSIGDISTSPNNNLSNYKCVPSECVEVISPGPIHNGPDSHNDNGSLTQFDRYNKYFSGLRYKWSWESNINVLNPWNGGQLDANNTNGYNLMRGGEGAVRGQQGNPYYAFKKECLEKTPNRPFPALKTNIPPLTKDVESVYGDLGIGWHGHPYKLDPKYSIFSFLNIVPEGIIINQGTGHRFYIIHIYEGDDVNLFYILTYNYKTTNYDGALQALDYDPNGANYKIKPLVIENDYIEPGIINQQDSTMHDVINSKAPKRVAITNLDATNTSQHWKIILSKDKKIFKIKNVYKNTYLYAAQEPREGRIEFTTIDIDDDNYKKDPAFVNLTQVELDNRTNFSFISSFGTQLNIIEGDNEQK